MNSHDFQVAMAFKHAAAVLCLRRHAAVYAPNVPQTTLAALCDALGEISYDDAIAELDRLQADTKKETTR